VGSDFNFDDHVSFAPDQLNGGKVEYNYRQFQWSMSEAPGISVFLKDDGKIYHTYSTYARGEGSLLPAGGRAGPPGGPVPGSARAPDSRRPGRADPPGPDEAEFAICDYWIEDRISLLKRRFGLARCRYHGLAGMERWGRLGYFGPQPPPDQPRPGRSPGRLTRTHSPDRQNPCYQGPSAPPTGVLQRELASSGARGAQPSTTWSRVEITSKPAASASRASVRSSSAEAWRTWKPNRNGRMPTP
jgi:hypothetical protein